MAKLPFLNRAEELARLERMLARKQGALAVVYGRRRCGKSRLIQEALPRSRSIFYVGDDREATLQRANLASEIARLLPGFDQAMYPEWNALFQRFWADARKGTTLVLDEFPSMVQVSPELPSILQKFVDQQTVRGAHLVLAGSSKRMMQGLVLDNSAPLYGRSAEILKISPLMPFWIMKALRMSKRDESLAVEAYSVWGGIPRYWELASDYSSRVEALRAVVLSPLGVLHEEPKRVLLDDLRETTQSSSILSLIGRGCHRVSEIAGRLEKPATSLSRPLQRLVELDLVKRETPFGSSKRTTKRSLYRISDPFLRYWFRFVEPNLSRLEARSVDSVQRDVESSFSHHVAGIWEELARDSVPGSGYEGIEWGPAGRWWGAGLDRRPHEIDVVAESHSGDSLLVGEVKWEDDVDHDRAFALLARKAAQLPMARGKKIVLVLWTKSTGERRRPSNVLTPREVLRVLR